MEGGLAPPRSVQSLVSESVLAPTGGEQTLPDSLMTRSDRPARLDGGSCGWHMYGLAEGGRCWARHHAWGAQLEGKFALSVLAICAQEVIPSLLEVALGGWFHILLN